MTENLYVAIKPTRQNVQAAKQWGVELKTICQTVHSEYEILSLRTHHRSVDETETAEFQLRKYFLTKNGNDSPHANNYMAVGIKCN